MDEVYCFVRFACCDDDGKLSQLVSQSGSFCNDEMMVVEAAA